ncbi:MAG: hypothetical protein ACPG8W_19280 [Candidatus Promineifilaceae bacterium]
MSKLDVYVAKHCWSCDEARKIVADLRVQFPNVTISLLDISPQEWPEAVFAVPTYLLNGRVISLGNPTRQMLHNTLLTANLIGTTNGNKN